MHEEYCRIKYQFPKANPLPRDIEQYTRFDAVRKLHRVIVLKTKTETDSSGNTYISHISAYRIRHGKITDYTDYYVLADRREERKPYLHFTPERAVKHFIDFVWGDEYIKTGTPEPDERNKPVLIAKDPGKSLHLIMDLFKRAGMYYSGHTSILTTPDEDERWRAEYDFNTLTLIDCEDIKKRKRNR
ncbi:MAG TPA: hypothetical protein O0X39_00675 [Methanocorpusculum sp.]|nr:hypothetical protein [Methanocorpusculum sp.]